MFHFRRQRLFGIIIILAVLLLFRFFYFSVKNDCEKIKHEQNVISEDIIFIGGYPRSGTTLMRVLLDVHEDVRCGPETHIIPKFLDFRKKVDIDTKNHMIPAGLYPEAFDSATRKFIHEIIFLNGQPARRLCVKDPFTLKYIPYISQLFPLAKFILMVRDVRAVAASLIKRSINIRGVDINNSTQVLLSWNLFYQNSFNSCNKLTENRCLLVKYENLVLRPQEQIHRILDFLDLPWNEHMLQHEMDVGDLSFSKREKSTSQVLFPIHLEALGSWASVDSVLSQNFLLEVLNNSFMVQFGYDKLGNPPSYGTPEPSVIAKTLKLRNNSDFRKIYPP